MRQDARDNREAIVTAARSLLIDVGPGVSMRAIAKEAEVGVATATRHFPERIDLLDAIGEHAVEDVNHVIDRHLDEFADVPRNAWRQATHEIGDLKHAALAQAIFADSMSDPATIKRREPMIEKRIREIRACYNRLLDPAKAAHLCPEDLDPIEFHIGLGVVTRPLPAGVPVNNVAKNLVPNLIDLLLDGLEQRAQG